MIQITKAEFETLPESLKAKFTADGESYILQEEDVDGLKKSKAEILEEKKKLQTERDALAKFKQEAEAKEAEIAEAKLKEAGETDAWKKQYDERHNRLLADTKAEQESLLRDIKRERLTNELIKRGAIPDRAAYLVSELDVAIDLVKTDAGFQLQKKGGIGDAAEFDTVIEAAKQKTPFFFAAKNASGSGASGSGQTNTTTKEWSRSDWDNANTQERSAFTEAGGKII